jgi:gp16 family phage-associated protein
MAPKPPRKKLLTPEQVKAKFHKEGKTVKQWAIENGYDPNRVYRVLGGFDKALWGKAHEIAVKLGMKAATEQEDGTDE